MRLKDKVALITGAGSGIGRESALLFAREGAAVAVVDVDEKSGQAVVDEILANGGKAIKADVSKAEDAERMVAETEKAFGKLDVLFNNAGVMISSDGDAISTSEDVWDLTLDINAKGVFLGCKYGIPALRRAGGGSIINTASFVATLGAATPQIAYTASKGAVLSMTRELAVIHARENIRVNALSPGPLRTELLMKFLDTEEKKQRRLVHIPMGQASEMAKAALFLASDDSSYMTGADLRVDGGITAASPTSPRSREDAVSKIQKTISPIDGSVYLERELASDAQIEEVLEKGKQARADWRARPLAERQALVKKMVDYIVAREAELAEELTRQMGRPIAHTPFEIGRGFKERAEYMIDIAPKALADLVPEPKEGFTRFIRREPLGTVLVLAPWNYPWLTSVNSVVPALVAGNTVILKMSAQTPLVAERYQEAADAAGLPEGVFQYVHASHEAVARMIGDERVDFVAFTGSVPGGHAVVKAASDRFIGTGLELGGKDPAYVMEDADLDFTVENTVDGAFFSRAAPSSGSTSTRRSTTSSSSASSSWWGSTS